SLPLAAQKRRNCLFDARGTQHLGVPELDQNGTFGVLGEATRKAHAPQLVGRAPTRSWHLGNGLRRPRRKAVHYGPSQRTAATVVLSLAAPVRRIARWASSRSFSLSATFAAVSSVAISAS